MSWVGTDKECATSELVLPRKTSANECVENLQGEGKEKKEVWPYKRGEMLLKS